jgi:hypothetical protein
MKIAILDDYQNVALKTADWTALAAKAEITVFHDHLADVGSLLNGLRRSTAPDSPGNCQRVVRRAADFGALLVHYILQMR